MAVEFGPHIERLYAVAGGPSGRLLAIAGERDAQDVPGSTVHLLQLPKLKPLQALAVEAPVFALAFSSARLLVAGTGRGELVFWEVQADAGGAEEGDEGEATGRKSAGRKPLAVEACHDGAVRAVAADPLGRFVASVGDDGTLSILKPVQAGGKLKLERIVHRALSDRPMRAVAIDPVDGLVACAGDDGVIRVVPLEAAATADVREMPCGEGGVGALCFTGDDRIAAGCGDGSIRFCFLHGAVDEENRSGDQGHAGPVRGLFLTPELLDEASRPLPRRLLSVGADGQLKAWPIEGRRPPRTVALEDDTVTAAALLAPVAKAKPAERGGVVAAVSRARSIFLVALGEKGEPQEEVRRVGAELARLAGNLDARSPKVRTAAVEALGAIPEDEAREALDRALARDPVADVRKLAAQVIGRTSRRLSRPALRKALNDSGQEVREAAFQALIVIEGEGSLAPIRAGLASSQADIRQKAVQRLPALRHTSPLVPSLIAERLKDPGPAVRLTALQSLYQLEGAGSLEPVRAAFERGPADVKLAALLHLAFSGQIRTPAGRALAEKALDDGEAVVRYAALLVNIDASPALSDALRKRDPFTRSQLEKLDQERARAGFKRPDPPAQAEDDPFPAQVALTDEELRPLFAALACRNADVALQGAAALGALGDPRAVGALLQLSREKETSIRLGTIQALAVAAMALPLDDRLTARIEWLMDDADPNLRAAALGALKELAAPRGAPGLLEVGERAIRSSREDIRVQALQILVGFGGQGPWARLTELRDQADALLNEALDDESQKVRREAFRTLWTWHRQDPEAPLRRAVKSAHADIRQQAVEELARLKAPWAQAMLLEKVGDAASQVGLAAYKALLEDKANRKRADIHLAALSSPRADVRATGCKECVDAPAAELRAKLVALVADPEPEVHIAAIEAVDRLIPDDAEAFATAFGSIFYGLQVRAAELCGRRRDRRAVGPMRELLSIPVTHINRPADGFRQRGARALADVGDPETIPFFVALLDDPDPIVREMAARGLATACRPGEEQPLVDALSHPDLPVRSWAAEGLARLGDRRAIPVLTGTLKHIHLPIRKGAVIGFTALGDEGVGGILQGLEDPLREVQDMVFAIIVARDVALARAGLPPDLLLSALSSSHPEIRFAAARTLELRLQGNDFAALVQELVGPAKLEKASDMKGWPDPARRTGYLNAVIAALSSDLPSQRYAAAQVLALRSQPDAFWKEAKRLAQPADAGSPWIPHTNYAEEQRQERRRDWVRSLFRRPAPQAETTTERVLTVLRFAGSGRPRAVPPSGAGQIDRDTLHRLVFGAYAGLVRQTPPAGDADETHRVRRDSLERLLALSKDPAIGREAVLPALRRAIDDPHHLVRKAAVTALRGLYPAGDLEPLRILLESSATDVGRIAVDELIEAALGGRDDAVAASRETLNAPNPEVRSYALGRLPRLYPTGSLEPWLLALSSQHADVRLSVVDRLMHATDPRVATALASALGSDHEDLRLKAAITLARRGDLRTVDVLAGFLRSEEAENASAALKALKALAHARPAGKVDPALAQAAAEVVAARLDDDPDRTANRRALIDALGYIAHPAGDEVLLRLVSDEKEEIRGRSLEALLSIALDREARPVRMPGGETRARYQEPLALRYLEKAASSPHEAMRLKATAELYHLDGPEAERLLTRLLEDRLPSVRVAAARTLARRVEHLETASLAPLTFALRGGRRELVLPSARGLASRRRPEAFQPLMLVFKAGEATEREEALLALGGLGDRRALEEILPLLETGVELPEEDRFLIPVAAEALGAMLPHLEDPDERKQVRELLERLAQSGEEEVRMRAFTGLRRAGDGRSRALLERYAADTDEDSDIRLGAVKELGMLGDPAAEPVLEALLDDDEVLVAMRARRALRQIFPGEITRYSIPALNSRHGAVSRPAADFLARYGDAGMLMERLGGIKDREVRQRLRQGLVRRNAIPVDALVPLLEGEAPVARAEAAWLAGSSGATQLRDAVAGALKRAEAQWREAFDVASGAGLLADLQDPDEDEDDEDEDEDEDQIDDRILRLRATEEAWTASLWASRKLEASVQEEAIRASIDGGAPVPVRVEALRYLGGQTGSAVREALEKCLIDGHAEVRSAAGAALARLSEKADEAERSSLAKRLLVQVPENQAPVDAASLAPLAGALMPVAALEILRSSEGRRAALPRVLGAHRDDELLTLAATPGEGADRLTAIASLGRIGGARAEAGLRAILETTGEADAVRAAAWKALRRAQRAATPHASNPQAP